MKLRKINKIVSFIECMVVTLVCISSCANKNDSFIRTEDHLGFDEYIYEIPQIEGTITAVKDILREGNRTYILAEYYTINDNSTNHLWVYGLNEEYEHCVDYEIVDEDISVQLSSATILNDMLAITSKSGTIQLYDLQTGEPNCAIATEEQNPVEGIETTDDGYIVLQSGKITKYFDSDSHSVSIESDALNNYYGKHPYYRMNEREYIVVYERMEAVYYELDFDNNQARKVMDAKSITKNIEQIYNGYIFNNEGLYKVDIENQYLLTMTLWNEVDIRPEYKALDYYSYYVNDDNHFVKTYAYLDGTAEAIFLEYNNSIDYSERITLTVGGYGLNDDLALKWAIYIFNQEQDNYRIKCEDYSESFSWSTAVEAQEMNARLIQYFCEGNAPDIFYGYSFDYDYLGLAGSVIDLSELIQNSNLDFENYRIINNRNDSQYFSVYSAYRMVGYFADSSIIQDSNITIDELIEVAECQNALPLASLRAADIADLVIRYQISKEYDSISESNFLSEKNLESVVEFAIENGISYNSNPTFALPVDVANGNYILCSSFVTDIYSYAESFMNFSNDFIFVGYPSVTNSNHIVYPYGNVAIASSTNYEDACWSFIECLFNKEVQAVLGANNLIPVDNTVLEKFVYYSVNPDEMTADDTIYNSYVSYYGYSIPESIANNYLQAIGTADTVLTYDWGIYNIICDEVNLYYSQGKPVRDIAQSLQTRLNLYIAENYG